MKSPVIVRLRWARGSEMVKAVWNQTDKLFRVAEWFIFLAGIKLVADKAKSNTLLFLWFVLFLSFGLFIQVLIFQWFEISIPALGGRPKLQKVCTIIATLSITLAITAPINHALGEAIQSVVASYLSR